MMSRFFTDRAYDCFDLGDESDQDRAERFTVYIDNPFLMELKRLPCVQQQQQMTKWKNNQTQAMGIVAALLKKKKNNSQLFIVWS